MSEQQANFEGWAILEIFGHQTFAGYVKTEYFGTACMFRLDVPPLPERQRVTKSGCYVATETDSRSWAPPGSTVKYLYSRRAKVADDAGTRFAPARIRSAEIRASGQAGRFSM